MPQKSKLEDMSSNDEIEEKTVCKAKKILSIKDIKDQKMINSINQLKEIAPWLSKLHNKDLTIIIKEEDQDIDEHEK